MGFLVEFFTDRAALHVELLLSYDLVLSWAWTLVVSSIGFGLISKAVFRSCGEGSTLSVLTRSWAFIPSSESFTLARTHFRAIGLEFFTGVIGSGSGLGVFHPAAVLGAHGECCGIFIDGIGGGVVVPWTGLQGIP
jgi:hypothetical protein